MQRLAAFWTNLRSSLWFVPAVIVLAAVVLGLFLAELGRLFPGLAQSELPQIFGFSAEGSRAMLSSIASSMITVAGVAFSITIVALSLASSQYSPRVLRHFMRDRGNQIVLGVFVGIFAYCLVVLPLVRGGEDDGYVPAVAVAFAVGLGLLGVACLIYFIHHVATAIQASSIVAAVAEETHHAVEKLFPETLGEDAEAIPAAVQQLRWHVIEAPASGMLQLVNESALLQTAISRDVVLRMECQIGDFVVAGRPLISTSGSDNDDEFVSDVRSAFTINRTRTIEQDAAFGLRQIVDVALRALSPSLNDTTTAILCVNYLADILRHAAARHVESRYRRHEGAVRVIATRPDFGDFMHLAFDQIRESGATNPAVLRRLLWAMETIGSAARTPLRRRILADAARKVGEVGKRGIADSETRTALVESAQRLAADLDAQSVTPRSA